MPGSITNYGASQTQNVLYGGGTLTPPATWYVGLSTIAADQGGSAVEPSGNGYTRVAVTNNRTNFAATPASGGSAGVTSNLTTITFPVPTGSWGKLLSYFIADASSSGNVWYSADLAAPRSPTSGDPAPSFAPGAFNISHA